MSYMENLKKSVNDSRVLRKSMIENDQSKDQNKSAVDYRSMDDMAGPSRFAEKTELENLKREINALKESMTKPNKEKDQFYKDRENKMLEEKLTEVPKAYLSDGITTELTNLKGKINKMTVTIEALEKTTEKLTDERNQKFSSLEKKVSDDLDSLKLLKDRIQIEVDLLKERASQIKASNLNAEAANQSFMLMNQSSLNPNKEGGKEDSAQVSQNKVSIETLTKVHENFKRETVLNLNQIKSTMSAITKRLGINDKNLPSNVGETPENREEPTKEGGVQKPGQPGAKPPGKTNQITLLDDEKLSQFEDKFYEHEMLMKKLLFEQKKELVEKFDILSSSFDDFKTRQSSLF